VWGALSNRLAANQPWCEQKRLGDDTVIDVAYAPLADGGWITTHLDVSERAKSDERIAYLALNDELTGASNRSVFLQQLETQIASKRPFVIMSLDLDRFKQVNDTYGHAAGDELLRFVVMRLKRTIRAKDVLARMGGDEFAFLFPDLDNRDRVDQIAQQLVHTISQPFKLFAATVEIGASVGIEFSNGEDGIDGEGLMRRADMALYRAKFQGRGMYCYAESPSAMIANFREQLQSIIN
jgi:diguanylate cyclase (GGDEF)-like protein